MKIIVTCAFGLESLVKRQLLDMGYENLNVNDGRIILEGDIFFIAFKHYSSVVYIQILIAHIQKLSFDRALQTECASYYYFQNYYSSILPSILSYFQCFFYVIIIFNCKFTIKKLQRKIIAVYLDSNLQ